jgi:hypothetical protein
MALNKDLRKPIQPPTEEPDSEVLTHIQSLGLHTVEEYQEWCGIHGFSRRVQKHWREQMKERAFANRAVAISRLTRKKNERRRPEKIIERIFRGELPENAVTQPHFIAVCRAYEVAKERHLTEAVLRLLLHVCRYADLLSTQPVISEYGWQEGNSFVEGLAALARFWSNWLRPVEDWRPRTHNSFRQFSSLARHLFARWPVPTFMDTVWFKGASAATDRQQHWFLHLGRGENIRTADLPLPYTKRMAHHFMQAPANLSVEAALRWGQIYALGGDERLVRAVVSTRLGTHFEHDEFWITVLRWLIAHPMFDSSHVGPIIDFIEDQRFTSQMVVDGDFRGQPPPQPNLTMKGRTPDSLLRQVAAWHNRLAKSDQPAAEWPRSGIAPFEFIEGSLENGTLKIWTFTELLTTRALVTEGRKMNHCVATYARPCAQGRCSIWTLELESSDGKRKVLTVEVNNAARLISQARGKCNVLPGEKQRAILRRWAEQARLHIASCV